MSYQDMKMLHINVTQGPDGKLDTESEYRGFNQLELIGILEMVKDEILGYIDDMDEYHEHTVHERTIQ